MLVAGGSSAWAWSDFALIGNFSSDTWAPIYLDKVNDNHFTGTIDASSWVNNKTYNFKFYNEENSGAAKTYWGSSYWNPDFTTQSSITIDEGNNSGNMTFKHNSAYSSYTVDAEYITNYWHVVITGVAAGPTYTVNIGVNASGGGTVSPSGDQTVGASGISVTATPNTGYTFKNWTVGGGATVASSTSATTTITATANGSVTANFQAFTPLTIYLQNDGNWGTPISAYVYKGDGSSAIKNAEWPGANMTALGNGKYSYTINNADLFDGKVIFVGNGSRYPADSQPGLDIESKSKIFNTSTNAWNLSGPTVTFTPTPGTLTDASNDLYVKLDGDADAKTYTCIVTKDGVQVATETIQMSVASVTKFLYNASMDGEYEVTVKNDADEVIATANYTVAIETKYTVNVSAEAGKGTVTPSGDVNVGATPVAITATPASGYQFRQWTTTGDVTVSDPLSASTTISATGAGTIKALFEDYVAPDMSYYLVGNFFDDDAVDRINYNRRYFKFNIQKDGRYMVELPAAVTAMAQIIGVTDAVTKFGPSTATYDLSATHPTTDQSATGTFAAANTTNYWNLTTRNDNTAAGDDDGLYEVWFTAGADGTPTEWEFKHVSKRRVAYFLSNATGATVNPVYNERQSSTQSYDNKTHAMVYIDPNQSYYTIGYVLRDKESDYINKANNTGAYGAHVNNKCQDVLPTTNKLFLMGNNGREFKAQNPYNEVSPHVAPIKVETKDKGLYKVEYNPSNGNNEWAKGTHTDQPANEKNTVGIRGQIIFLGGDMGGTGEDSPISSISMVGNAIPGTTNGDGTWNWASTVGDMAYDENDGCYKLTFTTTADQSVENRFRFVANHNKNMTWYEDGITDDKKARVPYLGTGSGHSCLPTDPNPVSYTVSDNTANTGVNIIFNRPAGTWTVRFYIDINQQGQKSYRYTITGSPSRGFDIPVYGGRVLCSFSSHKSLNIPAHFRAYVAHRFTPKEEGSDNTNDGHVDLYRIKYIPANVGVILYGDDPQHNYTTVTVPFTEYEGEDVRDTPALWYYPTKHTGETYKNYLVAAPDGTVLSTNGRLDTRSEYYDEETHTYKYYVYLSRYFAFTWFSKTLYGNYYDWTDNDMAPKSGVLKHGSPSGFPTPITDYASFYRAKGTVGKNRAYLVLPAEEMGYSGQALSQTQDETDSEGNPLFAKSGLRFEDFYYEDYSDEFSTAIQPIVNVANGNTDNTFYNVQGMKVANPTKGLYIINGKKMVVK